MCCLDLIKKGLSSDLLDNLEISISCFGISILGDLKNSPYNKYFNLLYRNLAMFNK